jgi:XTP/dITP diphosphohydrolase
MKELVFATNNRHKADEVEAMLAGKFKLKTLADIGCDEDIPETAPHLEGNAAMKSRFVFDRYDLNCFADDTGLEVEALNGEPGVFSARYAGPQKDSEDNMRHLLKNLEGKENRKARFRTVISLMQHGIEFQFEGIVNGQIIQEHAGDKGFGYDPIFQPEGYDRTFAQMDKGEKNAISHRGRAVRKLVEFLLSDTD